MEIENEKSLTFGLVHGAWHGAWCWENLQDELSSLGHSSIAMDLPIEDPDATFEDYADIVAEIMEDRENPVLVGHSRAGNVLPRLAARIAVDKLIYLCASFEKPTIGHPKDSEEHLVPKRNPSAFEEGIIPIGHGLTMFSEESAEELFYNDCPDELANWAVGQFRAQRRSEDEPMLGIWPDVPAAYILCTDDKIVNNDWSRYAARNWLGIEPYEMEGGHSPMLSRPQELAKVLIHLAS